MTSMPSVLNAAMAYAAFPYSTSFRFCAKAGLRGVWCVRGGQGVDPQ